jgi:hypothetical protein
VEISRLWGISDLVLVGILTFASMLFETSHSSATQTQKSAAIEVFPCCKESTHHQILIAPPHVAANKASLWNSCNNHK